MKHTALELYQIKAEDVKKSTAWFQEQIKFLSTKKITPNRVMFESSPELSSKLVPGLPTFFYYDPKYKDTLPFYDQFPLVLPFHSDAESFTGLNLHYLDYKPRMMLFQELLKITGNRALHENNKIKYSWKIVQAAANSGFAQHCVKKYLKTHVKSPFCPIAPEFWHTAIMLPVQRFVGASKESIWSKTSRK